jgi:hypothetical protein
MPRRAALVFFFGEIFRLERADTGAVFLATALGMV